MRARPLGAERLALFDTESVLLVDHDQTQIGERRLLAQQGMRADDDEGLSRSHPQRGFPPLGGRQLPGQEGGHHQRREFTAQHPGDRAEVLSGEHLGRRDECGLPTGFRHLQHRPEGDERLSRTHLALHEPVHGATRSSAICAPTDS